MSFLRGQEKLVNSPIPARSGVGLKARYYREVLDTRPDIGWFEVHTENYMGAGGPPHRFLEAIAESYPLSFHGVGLSLGSAEPLDKRHLARVRELADRYAPALVSEHLSWSISGGVFMNDLLPLPYTRETFQVVASHIDELQDELGRSVLIENPSTYLRIRESVIPEPEFMAMLADRTGCGILLDVNNAFVCGANHGFDPARYLAAFDPDFVGEIHLAGHTMNRVGDREIRVDDHGSRVIGAVWALYRETVGRMGRRPTLIEWDTRVPEFDVLLREAAIADAILSDPAGAERTIHDDAA